MRIFVLIVALMTSPAIAEEYRLPEAYLRIVGVAEDGFVRQQTVYKFTNMDACRKSIAAGKMYGATAGDAQTVVIMVCTEQKEFLFQYHP